jgi:hypothetical protein
LPGLVLGNPRSSTIGCDEWLLNSIVLHNSFLAGPFTDRVPAATLRLPMNLLTRLSIGLPQQFERLNPFGVPNAGLIVATAIPAILVVAVRDVSGLADLYAVGVVGAIATNLGASSADRKLNLKTWERVVMFCTFIVMAAIELSDPRLGTAWEKGGNNCDNIELQVCPSSIQESDVLFSTKNITCCNGHLATEIFFGPDLAGGFRVPTRGVGGGNLLQVPTCGLTSCGDSVCYCRHRLQQLVRSAETLCRIFLKEFFKEN